MAKSFDNLWESASAVLGWAIFGHRDRPDHDDFLVQLRGAYRRGLLGKESVILMRSEPGQLAEIFPMETINSMVDLGVLHSHLEEIDAFTHGSKVSVVLDASQVLHWQTNGAHAEIILDRIEAGELDPEEDLLRSLRGNSSREERLNAIDLVAARSKAGPGRVPTEEERVTRLRTFRAQEEIRRAMLEADERGNADRVVELAHELLRVTQESIKRRNEEFGGSAADR